MGRIKSNSNAQIIAKYKALQSRILALKEKELDKRISMFEAIDLKNLTRGFETLKTHMVLLQLEIPNETDIYIPI